MVTKKYIKPTRTAGIFILFHESNICLVAESKSIDTVLREKSTDHGVSENLLIKARKTPASVPPNAIESAAN